MEPKDKFGNPIYPKTWKEMCRKAQVLLSSGYVESSSKPNLFLQKHENGVFFADMRGTEAVMIWEDPCPLFYWRFSEKTPKWKQRRIIKHEMRKLHADGCECRLSFYEMCEPEGLMFGNDQDGYCDCCGKDFQDDGLYCSIQCRDQSHFDSLLECSVCHGKMEGGLLVTHHVKYDPEETILVCRPCHSKIHKAHRWILKPPEGEAERYYRGNKEDSEPKGSRRERYFELFDSALQDREIAERMEVEIQTVKQWRKKWMKEDKYLEARPDISNLVTCKNCGQEFNAIYRTTCPKCRKFL
ncbi:MAG: hypothetical protein ACW99U_21200 [Candidatus Thorarchaeota archaeon]